MWAPMGPQRAPYIMHGAETEEGCLVNCYIIVIYLLYTFLQHSYCCCIVIMCLRTAKALFVLRVRLLLTVVYVSVCFCVTC